MRALAFVLMLAEAVCVAPRAAAQASGVVGEPRPRAVTHVHASADLDELSLYRAPTSASVMVVSGREVRLDRFELVCRLPCDVDLPAGVYELGVARGTGSAVRRQPRITLPAGNVRLDVHYDDRSGLRLAGWITWIVGVVGGAALAITSAFAGPVELDPWGRSYHSIDIGPTIVGVSIFLLAIVVGFPLALLDDVCDVRAWIGGLRIRP